MEKFKKNKRGITLVALVITIIILLILAGITITQLTENGLLKKAQLAKEKSEKAQIDEKKILNNYENVISNTIISNRDNIVENNDIYSTEERQIGTWIDGKTIYRKVKKVEISQEKTTFDTDIPNNFETITNVELVYYGSGKRYFDDSYYVSNEDKMRYWFDDNHSTNMNLELGSKFPERPGTLYVCIEYTKST